MASNIDLQDLQAYLRNAIKNVEEKIQQKEEEIKENYKNIQNYFREGTNNERWFSFLENRKNDLDAEKKKLDDERKDMQNRLLQPLQPAPAFCTLDSLLRSDLSEIKEENVSKSMTVKGLQDLPTWFLYWEDFNDQMKIVENYVKSIQEPIYEQYIQPDSDKLPIPSHDNLTQVLGHLGRDVFAHRIFKGVIFGFFQTPNQNVEMVEQVGGELANLGDLFYSIKSKKDTNKFIYIHLIEVKTRASLPIDRYENDNDYNDLLVKLYNGKQNGDLSSNRVENLVIQMKDTMKSESNRGLEKVYTLVSTYENTFVLFYDNGKDALWISPPLPRHKLLLAMYFVLIIQLEQHGYIEGMLSSLARSLINESPKKLVSEENLNTSNTSSSSSSTMNASQTSVKENDQNKTPEGTPRKNNYESFRDSLTTVWKNGPREMIGTGRTCFVIKVSLKQKFLALKMVNVFKNARGSLKELEHENDVMLWINANTNLSIVPSVHYYGNISAYRTLVTTYIDGMCFNDFKNMSPQMREECRKSVKELHSFKILHGDLEPWNFIIKTFKAKSYKAYILDFGNAVLNANEESLEVEYENFCKAAGLDFNNTGFRSHTIQAHLFSNFSYA